MSEVKVQAVANFGEGDKKQERKIEVNYDFGANLDTATTKFGEETVYSNFVAQAKINLQAFLRRLMQPKEGDPVLSDEEIQKKVNEWQPGNKTQVRRSTAEKAAELLSKLSAEDKARLLAALQNGGSFASGPSPDAKAGKPKPAPKPQVVR